MAPCSTSNNVDCSVHCARVVRFFRVHTSVLHHHKKMTIKNKPDWRSFWMIQMRTKYIISLPGTWDKFFHSYVHAHKMLCPPYISARAAASFPFPLVLQMIPPGRNICRKSTRGPDEQQRSARAAFVCPLMQDIFQWTYTAQNPPSSHVLYQLCRNETSHNQSSTLQVTRIRNCVRPFYRYKRKCYDYRA